jgi:hypothetical protein
VTWRAGTVALIAKAIVAARLPLRLPRRTMAAPLTRTVAVGFAPRLTDGEVGFLSLRNMTFGAWERRANQPAMDGTFVLTSIVVQGFCIDTIRICRFARSAYFCVWGSLAHRSCGVDVFRRGFDRFVLRRIGGCGDGARPGIFRDFLRQCTCLLPARCWSLCLLVLVLGIARRAPRPPNIVLDHRDDNMIRDTALARTIVVQNVTEPKPALLHELPRGVPFGWE